MAIAILPEVNKRIAWNRETKDYDCYISIDGDQEHYIGSAPNHSAAEKTCNDFAFNYYEDNHTPEKAAELVMAGEPNPCNPDAPPEGASVWSDYEAGSVVIGIGESDYVNDIHIFGMRMEAERATLAALTQVHTDLGHLLADSRVQAALDPSAEQPTEMPR